MWLFAPSSILRPIWLSISATHLSYMYPGSASYATPQNSHISSVYFNQGTPHTPTPPFITQNLCLLVYIQMPSHNSPLPVHTNFSCETHTYGGRSKSDQQTRATSRDEGLQTLRVVTCNSECKAQKIMIFWPSVRTQLSSGKLMLFNPDHMLRKMSWMSGHAFERRIKWYFPACSERNLHMQSFGPIS